MYLAALLLVKYLAGTKHRSGSQVMLFIPIIQNVTLSLIRSKQ